MPPTSSMSTQLISGRELAAKLGLSPDTVRRWAAEGRIPSLRISANRRRFDWDLVLEALADHSRLKAQEVTHVPG